MAKQIGILGSGIVGTTLANGLLELGYAVSVGNRKGKAVKNWSGEIGNYSEISANAEIIILALKGSAAEAVVSTIVDNLYGKTVIDTTNPIADTPPEDGVLSYFTSLDESLMELLQAKAPKANFVKAFNSVGNEFMVKPNFKDGQPTMFICGDSNIAKNDVIEILTQLGWDWEDCGSAKAARAIEPLCILWCIPGLLNNKWSHAFKLLKT